LREEREMLCLMSARRLKPGAFEQFRRAWEPDSDDYPPGFQRAYHARNVRDEDEIVSECFRIARDNAAIARRMLRRGAGVERAD
ncbi:MAG: hypothetical protein ACJ8AD_18305, partial [Gemmatimonadaceae bacterium]